MALDYNNYMERAVAVGKEALVSISATSAVDAVPYSLYAQESTPYWTAHVGEGSAVRESADLMRVTQNFQLHLIAGYITEGATGELERKLNSWIPFIVQYFNERELTQSAAYPTVMDELEDAYVTNWTGVGELAASTVQSRAMGCEFTLTAEFLVSIRQVYL